MSRTRVAILGSTGSVGTQTLAILRDRRDRFEVVALSARRGEPIAAQAAEFSPTAVCLTDAEPPPNLPAKTTFHRGADGVLAALDQTEPDIVLNAITGAAGLPASAWTLRAGRRLALANKESLVMAGEHLMQLARDSGAIVLPVDSEHCAIHQCLRGEDPATIRRIWLTGSGGPFLRRPLATFASITREEALRHPTWTMGPRITIGSATMMNKAFEVLEAHWLFGLPPDRIQVVLHPQSIVHSMVEFVDGSIVAQCGVPDMRVPILYCLSWPERTPFDFQPFDPTRWRNLEFLPFDAERYPAVPLAYETLRLGGDSGAVLNAADEELTRLFLAGAVPFPAIVETTARILRQRQVRPATTLANVLAADREGRALASQLVPTTP